MTQCLCPCVRGNTGTSRSLRMCSWASRICDSSLSMPRLDRTRMPLRLSKSGSRHDWSHSTIAVVYLQASSKSQQYAPINYLLKHCMYDNPSDRQYSAVEESEGLRYGTLQQYCCNCLSHNVFATPSGCIWLIHDLIKVR